MRTTMFLRVAVLFGCGFVLCAGTAWADSFSSVIVYGDSLSDNGNLYKATGGLAPQSPPYDDGRYSNGAVGVEQLAATLGVPLVDYAFAGATTGVGNIGDGGTQSSLGFPGLPGMLAELKAFPPPAALVPNGLFVVWGGADDFEIGGSVTTAVQDIDYIVGTLEKDGAQHILVPGLPDLGLTPEFYGDPAATLYTTQFNALLQASLPGNAIYDDVYGLLNTIVNNKSAYGFTDVKDQCLVGTTPCANQSQYLFWDDIHPTTAADALLAQQFEATVAAASVVPTPEPESLVLLGTGMLGMAGLMVRRQMA